MATNAKNGTSKAQTQMQTLADGLSASTLTQLASVVVLGSNLTKAEAIAKLRTWVALYTAVITAKQAFAAAVTARTGIEETAKQFVASLIVYIKQMVGPNNPAVLATLGINPPKTRKQPGVNTKALAAAKSAATRKARGTMSKQQRQSLTVNPEPTLQFVGVGGASSTSAPVSPSAPATTRATPSAS